MGPVSDTVSEINGNKDGLTFCGERLYRIIESPTASSFLTLSDAKQTLTIASLKDEDEGDHTVKVEISLRKHPEIIEVATITISINPCQVTSFIGVVTPEVASYAVDSEQLTSFDYEFT